MVLDTKDVRRRPGTMSRVSRSIAAPADFGTVVIGVDEGTPLEVDIRLESVVEGILVTGSVRAAANGTCVRCLDPVESLVEASFQELFAYADRAAHHRDVGDSGAAEDVLLEDGLIDLEAVLRDAVVPTLPFQPVCRPDCPGLCPQCGARRADDPDHRHDDGIDPRWSALSVLAGTAATDDHEKRT